MKPVELWESPPAGDALAVAYSGGRDSSAMLHATLAAAAPLGLRVFALHVQHGLNPHAETWLEHCRDQCEHWRRRGKAVHFNFLRLMGQPARGESIEAWAREQRYHALRAMAKTHGVGLVLLAQHRRDQAETLLIQAFRGAGVAGLSGMPEAVLRGGIVWARPWLDVPRDAIEAYARRHRLRFVDDQSNADPRFVRNRIRLEVWPALQAAFPNAETSLAATAQWAQQACACLEEMAALDLAAIGNETFLNVTAWKELSVARRANALRAWLRAQFGRPAEASLTIRLLAELAEPARARNACWPCGSGTLTLFRGRLSLVVGSTLIDEGRREPSLSVTRAGDHELAGWSGLLRVRRCRQGGLPLAWLAQLELRARGGGEKFQAGLGRPPRSLKKQYQAAGVAPWLRSGPLFYSGGQLVFAPGLGIDARVLALPGQPQVRLSWHELPPR